jgi:hypothetical protein
MYGEMKNTGQISIVVYFEVAYQHMIGSSLENHGNPVSITSVSSETQTGYLQNASQGVRSLGAPAVSQVLNFRLV